MEMCRHFVQVIGFIISSMSRIVVLEYQFTCGELTFVVCVLIKYINDRFENNVSILEKKLTSRRRQPGRRTHGRHVDRWRRPRARRRQRVRRRAPAVHHGRRAAPRRQARRWSTRRHPRRRARRRAIRGRRRATAFGLRLELSCWKEKR